MGELSSLDVDELAHRFFAGEGPVNEVTEKYSRKEICDYMGRTGAIEAEVSDMSGAQCIPLAGGMPGMMQWGWAHFDNAELIETLVKGYRVHWWG